MSKVLVLSGLVFLILSPFGAGPEGLGRIIGGRDGWVGLEGKSDGF
jgi:hypothetical protein